MDPTSVLPKRDIHLFYRTQDMVAPSMRFEISEKGDEVACMASFVPTFEPKNPQEFAEVSTETPESATLQKGKDFHFIFVVDRSGSMGGRRMELTQEAMNLFV